MKNLSRFIKRTSQLILGLSTVSLFMFSNARAADYYWVGGSGNWSDYAVHWSTTSGGTIFHASIPTLNDNVYFDAVSFSAPAQTIVFDNTFIYCNNMDWSGVTNNPAVNGLSSKLHVYGSLILSPNMSWAVKRIDFLGTGTGNVINSAGNALDTLYKSGTGTLELQNDLNSKSLFLYDGIFSTNNFPVTVKQFVAGLPSGTVTVDLGTSLITLSDLFKAYDGVINLNSSNADILVYNTSQFYSLQFWCAGKTFRNVNFQSKGEIIGSINCEKITTSASIYFNGSSSTSNIGVAEFGYDARLNTTANIDSITMLNPGTSLLVKQLNIGSFFSCIGVCGQPIEIKAYDFVPLGVINMSGGTVNLDYCIITSVDAAGGATFTATNSIDAGGNSGWNISSAVSRSLYWVGGSGNWNDENHWSLSSGGSGPNCIPSSIDDVFFNASSFQMAGDSVVLNGVQATCRDMNWNGATFTPKFMIAGPGSSNLYINGSLTLIPNMTLQYNSMEFVGSNLGNTLFSAGHSFNSILFNTTGSWSLLDDLHANGIQVYKGTFNTNSFDIYAKAFSPNGISNSINVDLGSSTLYLSENYMAFAPAINVSSSNANMILNDPSGNTIYVQLSNADFNDVTVQSNTYFSGILNCNKFESLSTVTLAKLFTPSATFHRNISAGKIVADSMFMMPEVVSLRFDTIQINDVFSYSSSCSSTLFMGASLGSNSAVFSKSTGIINLDYVYLSNIEATGGATFNANNCWDLGGNSGWNISTPAARNLYWVGGGGEWNDSNHWALTSNGSPGNCYPSKTDNVFFDNNSFTVPGDTIIVASSVNVYCNNLTVAGVPSNTLLRAPNSSTFFIDGSLTMVPELNLWNISYEMTSQLPGNTITTGANFISGLTMAGAGSWALQDSINAGNLFFKGGSFYSNDHKINTGGINTSGNTLIDLGYSTVTLLGFYSSNPSVVINGANADIIMTSSFLDFRVNNGYFNSITFTGKANTQFNFSCNRLYAMGDFTNINSQITAGYAEFKDKVTLALPFVGDSVLFDNPGKLVVINQMTINSDLQMNGNAGFPIQIEGYNGFGTITKATGLVCIDHVLVKDILATGGAQFFAGGSSVDLGGNSGWNFSVCSPITDVWPGDANYDLVADNFDILNIGLAYGYVGPVRVGASLNWVAQPANDWAFQFANFTNLKHADTDGSGLVDFDDTLAVTLNYGLTHPFRIYPNVPSSLPTPVLYVIASPDTVFTSDTVQVEIYLGTSTTPVDSIYGIAFTINVDTALVNANFLSVDYSGCWMGMPQSDLITFHKDLLTDGKVDFALVRNDQQNISGFGFIARMGIVIVDNVGAKITTPVIITDVKAITAAEYLLAIGIGNDSIVIDTTLSVGLGSSIINDLEISIFPNPANGQINIKVNNSKSVKLEIYNSEGKLLQLSKLISTNTTVDTSNLPMGVYFIRAVTESGVLIRRFEIVRN